jgi:hypothetical protein
MFSVLGFQRYNLRYPFSIWLFFVLQAKGAMNKLAVLKRWLANPLGRWLLVPYRAKNALSSCAVPFFCIIPWLIRSREFTNFTYNYTPLSLHAAIHLMTIITQKPAEVIWQYVSELQNDQQLHQHVARMTSKSAFKYFADSEFKPGRRMFFYLLVRAIKPRVVVEAGLDKGLGACIIGAALLKNTSEGHPGRYYGLTLNAQDPYLFDAPYDTYGELVIGDSVDFIRNTELAIDLFFHDTSTDPVHEHDQYEALTPRLRTASIVQTTWFTEMFVEFAQQSGLSLLTFHETPASHWYPGGTIAFAFKR